MISETSPKMGGGNKPSMADMLAEMFVNAMMGRKTHDQEEACACMSCMANRKFVPLSDSITVNEGVAIARSFESAEKLLHLASLNAAHGTKCDGQFTRAIKFLNEIGMPENAKILERFEAFCKEMKSLGDEAHRVRVERETEMTMQNIQSKKKQQPPTQG